MFDQNPSMPTGQAPSEPKRQSPPPTNLPGAPRPPQVEDIFSDTEIPSSAKISRPIQPGQASQMQVSGDIYGGRSIWDNKVLLVVIALVGLVVIGGVVWAAVNFFTSQRENINTNTNTNLNTNLNTNVEVNTNENINTNNENINTNTEVNANENVNTNTNTETNGNINTNANTNTNVPIGKDSDNDGLGDEEEKQLGTNPNNFDTDGDGLTDKVEVRIYHTDPLKKDTDGDGYNDGDEVVNGFDPTKGGGARLFNVP